MTDLKIIMRIAAILMISQYRIPCKHNAYCPNRSGHFILFADCMVHIDCFLIPDNSKFYVIDGEYSDRL